MSDPQSAVKRIEQTRNDLVAEATTLEATVRAKRSLLEEAVNEVNRRRTELDAEDARLQEVRDRIGRLSKGLSAARVVEDTLVLVETPITSPTTHSRVPYTPRNGSNRGRPHQRGGHTYFHQNERSGGVRHAREVDVPVIRRSGGGRQQESSSAQGQGQDRRTNSNVGRKRKRDEKEEDEKDVVELKIEG